jgi:hypothetical protein
MSGCGAGGGAGDRFDVREHATGIRVWERRGDLFDKPRALMEAWAYFCSHPEAKGDRVVHGPWSGSAERRRLDD